MSTGRALFQTVSAQSLEMYGTDRRWGDKSFNMSLEAPSAEAKKADGARIEQLRNPRPPLVDSKSRLAPIIKFKADVGYPGDNGLQ